MVTCSFLLPGGCAVFVVGWLRLPISAPAATTRIRSRIFWGFIAGAWPGATATLLQLKKRTPVSVQHLLAAIVPAALIAAWLFARQR